MAKKAKFTRVGVTTDGRPVYDVFDFCDRYGVALPVLVAFAKDHEADFAIGWERFLTRGYEAGWNMKRKLVEIEHVLQDSFGQEWAAAWLSRAEALVTKLEAESNA